MSLSPPGPDSGAAAAEPAAKERYGLYVAALGAVGVAFILANLSTGGLAPGHDLLWALRAGQWQAAHRAVLTREIWSWTANGAVWVNHEWLWDLAAWGLYRLGGWYGIEAGVALAAAAAYLLLVLAARTNGVGRGWAPVMGLAGLVLSAAFWTSRAQTAGYACFAGLLWLLARARRSDWPWAVLLGILWANLHGGGAILGVLVPLAAGVLDLVAKEPARARARLQLGLFVGLGTLVNPFGPDLWRYAAIKAVGTGGYALLRTHISEWQPPHTSNPYILIVLVMAVMIFVGAARRSPWSWRDLILACCFFAAALFGGRYLPYLAFWAVYALRSEGGPVLRPALALPFLVVVAALGVFVVVRHPNTMFAPKTGAAQMLAAARTDLAVSAQVGHPCWNTYVLGDYILWLHGHPSMDSRADPYVAGGTFAKWLDVEEGKALPRASCVVMAKPEFSRVESLRLQLAHWTERKTADVTVFIAPGAESH